MKLKTELDDGVEVTGNSVEELCAAINAMDGYEARHDDVALEVRNVKWGHPWVELTVEEV